MKHYHQPAPEVEAEMPAEAEPEEIAEESSASSGVSAAPAAKKRSVAAEPANRDDAMQRLTIVAHFLRHENPQNPVPYLLLRAMRWGEVRAVGTSLNPAILELRPRKSAR